MLISPVLLSSPESENILNGLFDRFQAADSSCQQSVNEILEAVKNNKDDAIVTYGRKFDAPNLSAEHLQVSSRELQNAYELVDEVFLDTLSRAIERIQTFHEREMEDSWLQTREDGTACRFCRALCPGR